MNLKTFNSNRGTDSKLIRIAIARSVIANTEQINCKYYTDIISTVFKF